MLFAVLQAKPLQHSVFVSQVLFNAEQTVGGDGGGGGGVGGQTGGGGGGVGGQTGDGGGDGGGQIGGGGGGQLSGGGGGQSAGGGGGGEWSPTQHGSSNTKQCVMFDRGTERSSCHTILR